MYMSGRALHPLTLTLAQLVTRSWTARCRSASAAAPTRRTSPTWWPTASAPVTVCTDLLKPGGYARLQQYLVNLDQAMAQAGADRLHEFVQATSGGHGARFNLARHAVKVVGDDALRAAPPGARVQGRAAPGPFRLHRRALHGRLPRPPEHPRLSLAGGPRPARRGHGRHPAHQSPARHHRQRLRPPLHREAACATSTTRPWPSARSSASPWSTAGQPGEPRPSRTNQGRHRRRRAGAGCPRPTSWPRWASSPRCSRPRQALGGMVSGVDPRLPAELRDDGRRHGAAAAAGRAFGLRPGPGPRLQPGGPARSPSPTSSWGWAPSGKAARHRRRDSERRDGRAGVPGQGAVPAHPGARAGASWWSAAAIRPWTRPAPPAAWSRTAR